MKKGYSKNRHFSKGINRLKSQKRLTNRKGSKKRTIEKTNVQLAEKSLKWSRIACVIQLADFLIDRGPRLVEWLFYLLGMG